MSARSVQVLARSKRIVFSSVEEACWAQRAHSRAFCQYSCDDPTVKSVVHHDARHSLTSHRSREIVSKVRYPEPAAERLDFILPGPSFCTVYQDGLISLFGQGIVLTRQLQHFCLWKGSSYFQKALGLAGQARLGTHLTLTDQFSGGLGGMAGCLGNVSPAPVVHKKKPRQRCGAKLGVLPRVEVEQIRPTGVRRPVGQQSGR
jgi:hypothetical protein